MKGKHHLWVLGIDGRIVLQWILKSKVLKCSLYSYESEYGQLASFCVHGNEH
jgi:hypothetical protein